MNILITQHNGISLAELEPDGFLIREVGDALDFMANGSYLGAEGFVVLQHQLAPEFFDLKSGLAGEILQKFSTYNHRLAIVGDFENVSSQSLRDFIRESNRVGRINFVGTIEEGRGKLARS